MSAISIFLIAAKSMISCASRIKYQPGVVPHTMAGLMHGGTMIDTALNLPQLQMPAPGVVPATWAPFLSHRPRTRRIVAIDEPPAAGFVWGGAADEAEQQLPVTLDEESSMWSPISDQTFPPAVLHGTDSKQLLNNWVESFTDQSSKVLAYWPHKSKEVQPQEWQDDKAKVLLHMRLVVVEVPGTLKQLSSAVNGKLSQRRNKMMLASQQLEMVALLPKDLAITRLSAVDASVQALGVFSRGQIKDDSSGSLRKLMTSLSRTIVWGRGKKQFDVLALEGLADAPFSSSLDSASVLLSKIEQYADKENRIVVVSKQASTIIEGKDLTDYYVRLGFEKVEMEGGAYELVYTRGWLLKKNSLTYNYVPQDMAVDHQQIMVGMNLWAGTEEAAPLDDDVARDGMDLASGLQGPGNVSDAQTSQQKFPPILVDSIDSKQYLDDWADSFMDPSGKVVVYGPETPKDSQDDKAMVLHDMQIFTQKPIFNGKLSRKDRLRLNKWLVKRNSFEMVGLIPKDLEVPYLPTSSSAADASVLALGVFSRGKLKDDSRGSLRNLMASSGLGGSFAQRYWGATKEFRVFAIKGLVDGPGKESSAKVLLSRIEKYAHEENRIVVVDKQAYIGSDGKDLTEYYVRLGFEKVDMVYIEEGFFIGTMREGYELVYTKGWSLKKGLSSDGDMAVENQEVMVGMNLWNSD